MLKEEDRIEKRKRESVFYGKEFSLPIVPSNMNVLLVGMAQEHKSHVVRPSLSTGSSTKKGGRGGGGTKRPFHNPCSLASKAMGDPNKSSSSSKMSNVTSPKLLKSCSAELATKLSIRGGLNVGSTGRDDPKEEAGEELELELEEEDVTAAT